MALFTIIFIIQKYANLKNVLKIVYMNPFWRPAALDTLTKLAFGATVIFSDRCCDHPPGSVFKIYKYKYKASQLWWPIEI